MNHCFRCGHPRKVNAQNMCPPCMTVWLGMSPADRRRLIHLVRVAS